MGKETPLLARQDAMAGLAIIVVAALASWLARDLPGAPGGGMGPGTLPKALAVLLAALGFALFVVALLNGGARIARGSLRGPLMVLGALVLFGLAVRPLGLALAGPLAIAAAACASSAVRWRETLVYAALMTLFCAGLFKFALGLPIPLAPWLVGF